MTKATNKRPATKTASRRSITRAASQPSATKTTSKTTAKTPAKPAAKPSPLLIVLGYDDQHKPRGARFVGADPDLVKKAAAAMDLQVYEVLPSSDLVDVAKKLPVGRIHANGQGFVPNVKLDLYSEVIVELADGAEQVGPTTDPPNLPAAKGLPRTWDEIGPGHLVIAQETLYYGWWEAVVIARNGDTLTLRYRDYPKIPKFFRNRSGIALMASPAAS